MNAPQLRCDAKHETSLRCALNWHTGPHKAALFDGDLVVYAWDDANGDLRDPSTQNVMLFAPGKGQANEWKPREFLELQFVRMRESSSRYCVRDNRAQTLATITVHDDGLVQLYSRQGCFGYFWPGPLAFGQNGIRAFLAGIEGPYAADKFTFHWREEMTKKAKLAAQMFISEMWPYFVVALKRDLEVRP